VTDDGTPVLNDLATVTIAVTNANEPPVVTGATYFVLEQPPLGIALGTLQAADPDAGQTLTWSITGGNTGNAFAINATTGLITVATPSAIVAATNPTFSLVVQASDNGVPVANGSATVTINVIANNQPPVVADQAFTLPENSAAGTVVGTIVAADPDAGQSIVYAIAGGNAAGAFAINAATGELTIANPAALDFETNPTLSVTFTVSDNVIPGGSDTAVITVNLTNVNDPPAISPATFTVIEFTPNGSLVGTVGATDQDAGQTITYALLSGNAGNVFALDATTGMITIADTTQIDFATVPSYSLMVQATDSGNPAASSTAAITINVSDVNRPPYLPDQAFRVFEGGPPGTLVGTVFTSDPDVGQPQMLSIIGGNVGNAFAIHPTSGKITINNSFAVDFETMPVFNLTVEVRDNSLMPQIKTATMLVEVLDVVEQPMIQPQSFTIAENRPVGYIVGTVVASHFDPMATLTYAITGGNADGIFAINAATGQLKVAKATLNFEATPEMTVTVTVTDDGMPALSRSASMTITVLDLNEAPTFPPATFNISENRPVGYVVGSVKAFDQDVGQSLTYVITGGNTNGTFAINAFTGAITVAKGSLNHEATPQFLLTVSVTDNGTPAQNRSAAVTINILNLNESPVINPQTFTVSENRPVGFVVGQIAAFDQDLGQTLTYAILGGDPNGIFAVNPLGQLVVAKPILNFEAMNAFPLQVSVTDNGSPVQSRSAPITVNVRDLNEAPVVNPQTFTIAEKQPLGASVGTVAAFDQDFNQTLQFAITAGNTSGAFAINAATGQITVANSAAQLFDVNPEFNLTVTVSDNGVPVQSRTAAIKVKLLKVNAKPVVAPQRFSVPENSPAGTNVGTVVATDSDVGQTLKYAITGGNTGGAFAINMTTGQITVANPAAINFETANLFQLTVSATDNGTPVQVGTGMVTIDVLDANDPPIVTNQTFQVAENVPANTLVATVLAQDPEGLPNLKYEIVGGNPNGAFVIDPNTGAVRVSAPFMFDFETNPQLSFLLKVSDSGSPVMSSTATITFQLTNLNDAPVVPTQTFSVSRSANNGATVGTIAASDQDAGQSLRYEIVGGNAGTAFGINLNTGVLFVANRNAFTGRVSIPLTVKVTDNGSNSLSATAGITVNITNGAAVIAKSSGNSGETKFALQGTLASQTVTPSGPAAPVTKPKAAAAATVTADEGANALLQRAVADKVVSKQDA
ncbi:MAG: cadherin domain-containing protein, partial [Planctomycetaceae bacterium]|nr:cadherin domain-containing protein [Planctomycetaceae bacterium]